MEWQEGIGVLCRMAGFLGQRLYFGNKTRNYTDIVKIDIQKCIGYGKCVKICPMHNMELLNGKVITHKQCTMCYRCANDCPKQTITLLGKEVYGSS